MLVPPTSQPLSDEEELIWHVSSPAKSTKRILAEMQSQGYSCKTTSESELVVQLKRDRFNLLIHLRGEFKLAFILYDLKGRLVRRADRFGIKPLA
ncbi:hypothetical protein GGX14DRAFT_696541 [Mycena pura]|uniref:Glutamine amidotransferase type-2 domain-containing protein n=1 Tax=Mycena pura TaxID=153505 RepID=A0AAD6YEB0_9AGAR|nr:hypothetical protein GGX14DRAFT_696541 [Mycena pura]